MRIAYLHAIRDSHLFLPQGKTRDSHLFLPQAIHYPKFSNTSRANLNSRQSKEFPLFRTKSVLIRGYLLLNYQCESVKSVV